jgi:prophage regulatory protein
MSTKTPGSPDRPPYRIIRKPALRERLGGCSDHHIDDLETREGFPRHIRIAGRSVGWLEHEVDAWIEARMRKRDQASPATPKPRPLLADKMGEQFHAEESKIRAKMEPADLSERERCGDVRTDVLA